MDQIEELKHQLTELEEEIRTLSTEISQKQQHRDYLNELRLQKMRAINEELQKQIDEAKKG